MKRLTPRELALHTARVYLAEARRSQGTSFAYLWLRMAANARRRASPAQQSLPFTSNASQP